MTAAKGASAVEKIVDLQGRLAAAEAHAERAEADADRLVAYVDDLLLILHDVRAVHDAAVAERPRP